VRVLSSFRAILYNNWPLGPYGNGQMRSKRHTALITPLVLQRTRIGKYAMKKFCINGQWLNKLFLIVISRFSLVKDGNAPRVFKLRKNCLTGIDQCAMVLSKKYKRHIYDCKLRKEKKVRYKFSPLNLNW
jgi:hypothetical protein